MAVLTLHRPGTLTPGNVHLGNYLDLSSGQVHIFQTTGKAEELTAADELRQACSNLKAPERALLANLDSGEVIVNMAVIGDHSDDTLAWADKRLLFDRMTYENASDGKSVEQLNYGEVNLADKATGLGAGTRAVIRFVDHDLRTRYFRILVHTAIDEHGHASDRAFTDGATALQFEELVEGRVLVPLGIRPTADGYEITTSTDIPAHFVSQDVSSLMWSIRPSDRAYVGAELYDRSFPVATVVFRVDVPATEHRRAHVYRYRQHPPPWVGCITQRNLTSRSYMNSTFCIAINDRGRQHRDELLEVREDYQHRGEGTVRTVRYWYNLVLVDGSTMTFEDYDPPVDVEDEH